MIEDILISEFNPASELRVKEHHIEKPAYPVIDFHTHFGLPILSTRMSTVKDETVIEDNIDLVKFLNLLDELGIEKVINLNGFWGKYLDHTLKKYYEDYPDRFAIFGCIDVERLDDPDFAAEISQEIKENCKKGMKGLKFYKRLGLLYRDSKGELIMPDDDRLAPIWETAAEQNIPVLIHIADPVSFFKPVDKYNERFEILRKRPQWSVAGPEYPEFEELLQCQENLLTNNPETTFVIAHVGSYSENLGYVSEMLDRHPNIYIDTAARFKDLGRQPYTARKFLIDYEDRILYGTDFIGYPDTADIRLKFRFLETADEYFPYTTGKGLWSIYGLSLPEKALKKIYYENAIKVLS